LFHTPVLLWSGALSSVAHATAEAAAEAVAVTSFDFPLPTVAIFVGAFIFSLVMDLVQHKDHKPVTVKNAAGWSIFWVALSLSFAGWLKWYHADDHPGWFSLFITGYVLEKTLSVDNLMVFIAIFRYFKIKSGLQHRILYFGILGAIGFRALFVGVGSGLLAVAGPWAEVIFGAFVLWAAVQMVRGGDDDEAEPDYSAMPLVKFFERFFPIYPHLSGVSFFVGRGEAEALAKRDPSFKVPAGVTRWMTPAFLALLVVEGSDVMFSVDSVPAVIAVSKDPLIIYTSMIFAVLGLRSLYFIVEALTRFLSQLERAVIGVLFFIGVKMLLGAAQHLFHFKVPWWGYLSEGEQANASLVFVLSMLTLGVVASLIFPGEPEEHRAEDGDDNRNEGDAAPADDSKN
jgi:tellurite resistance protein TerC